MKRKPASHHPAGAGFKPALLALVIIAPFLASCGATAESLRVGTNSAMATVKITRSVEVSGIKAEHGLEAVLAEAAKVEGAKNGR